MACAWWRRSAQLFSAAPAGNGAAMTDFYHMSATPLSVGSEIRGNGKDKIDPRIESELEARKPAAMLSRRDAGLRVP
jgi:hypothetical protein